MVWVAPTELPIFCLRGIFKNKHFGIDKIANVCYNGSIR